MEHAGLIALITAGAALMALVYIALFIPGSPPKARDKERKQAHYQRWEDRL